VYFKLLPPLFIGIASYWHPCREHSLIISNDFIFQSNSELHSAQTLKADSVLLPIYVRLLHIVR